MSSMTVPVNYTSATLKKWDVVFNDAGNFQVKAS